MIRRLIRSIPLVPLALAAGLAGAPSAMAAPAGNGPRVAPVATFVSTQFGRVLAVRAGKERGKALYYWSRELDRKIRCVDACARAWPPLLVPRNARVVRRVPGVRGTFGTVRRPEGTRQVTFNGLPIYTYVNEGRRQVLCNDVDGWFVVRARGLR